VINHTIERRAPAKQTFTGEERLIALLFDRPAAFAERRAPPYSALIHPLIF
jgi:hypothetical protein